MDVQNSAALSCFNNLEQLFSPPRRCSTPPDSCLQTAEWQPEYGEGLWISSTLPTAHTCGPMSRQAADAVETPLGTHSMVPWQMVDRSFVQNQ